MSGFSFMNLVANHMTESCQRISRNETRVFSHPSQVKLLEKIMKIGKIGSICILASSILFGSAAQAADMFSALKSDEEKNQELKRANEDARVAKEQWLASCRSSKIATVTCNQGKLAISGPIDAVNRQKAKLCPEFSKAPCEFLAENLKQAGRSPSKDGWNWDNAPRTSKIYDPLEEELAYRCEQEKVKHAADLAKRSIGVKKAKCE